MSPVGQQLCRCHSEHARYFIGRWISSLSPPPPKHRFPDPSAYRLQVTLIRREAGHEKPKDPPPEDGSKTEVAFRRKQLLLLHQSQFSPQGAPQKRAAQRLLWKVQGDTQQRDSQIRKRVRKAEDVWADSDVKQKRQNSHRAFGLSPVSHKSKNKTLLCAGGEMTTRVIAVSGWGAFNSQLRGHQGQGSPPAVVLSCSSRTALFSEAEITAESRWGYCHACISAPAPCLPPLWGGVGGGIWGLIFVLGSFLNLILCKEPWREVKLKVALWVPFPWPLPPPEGFVCKNLAAAQLGRL